MSEVQPTVLSIKAKKQIFEDIRIKAFNDARDLGGDIGDTFSNMKGVPAGVIALAIGTAFAELAGSLAAMAEHNSIVDEEGELRSFMTKIFYESFDQCFALMEAEEELDQLLEERRKTND